MPRVHHPSIITQVKDGEITIKLELTLNINTNEVVSSNKTMSDINISEEFKIPKQKEVDFIIPEFTKSNLVEGFGK